MTSPLPDPFHSPPSVLTLNLYCIRNLGSNDNTQPNVYYYYYTFILSLQAARDLLLFYSGILVLFVLITISRVYTNFLLLFFSSLNHLPLPRYLVGTTYLYYPPGSGYLHNYIRFEFDRVSLLLNIDIQLFEYYLIPEFKYPVSFSPYQPIK